jgi:hypothetical protein
MWRAIWDLVKAPFSAIFTGRYMGHPVESRNPLRWVSMWGWAILACAFVLLIYPVLLVAYAASTMLYARQLGSSRLTDAGIEVVAKRGATPKHYDWSSISEVRTTFIPPFTHLELALANGEFVVLWQVDTEELASALAQRGIRFDKEPHHRT